MRNSKIILAKGIKIDKNYNNVLDYNESEFLELLRSENHLIYEADNYSFIDEFQNIINVSIPYGDCISLNYMAFQNPRYNDKWFFCFIDKIEYNSEKSVNITFHVDSWSTWYSSINRETCYVLREHVADDTIGLHTIEEGIDTGETIAVASTQDSQLDSSHFIVVATNWNPSTEQAFSGVTVINRSVWGSILAFFPLNNTGITNLRLFIAKTNADARIEDIRDIFIIPSRGITTSDFETSSFVYEGETGSFNWYNPDDFTYRETSQQINIAKRTSFTGVSIKNNKCFCYPYNYLMVSNNVGSQNTYRYEDFSTTNCVFDVQTAIAVGCSGRAVPLNYKGLSENIDEALTLAKYPTCQWSSDSYTNWLTQNAVNIEKQNINIGFTGVKAATNFVGNLMNLQFGSALMGAVDSAQTLTNQIMDLQGSFYQARLLPNIVGGGADGNVNFASLDNGFKFINMQCKKEYIMAIDSFFNKFGYKVLTMKIPETRSRNYWNYVQTGAGEIFVTGNAPQEDLSIINSIAQKGVTIWHNHENIGNYNLTNSIRTN